ASKGTWGGRGVGVLVLALAVNKTLAAPAAVTVATNMLFAIVTGALLLHLLLSQRHGGANGRDIRLEGWIGGIGCRVLGEIAIAVFSVYPTFAAFVAARAISISAILGGLYLLLALANALFGERLAVFFFQAEDGIRDWSVTGVQTCALPI